MKHFSGYLLDRVERKERARLKTVKFNAKPGSFDSKGVSDWDSERMVGLLLPEDSQCS